jgi:hypothetical protein
MYTLSSPASLPTYLCQVGEKGGEESLDKIFQDLTNVNAQQLIGKVQTTFFVHT